MDSGDEETLIGKTLGNYRIEGRLGAGGMGEVYRGFHLLVHRPVAIKTLHPEIAANRDSVKRFFAEAQAVNMIRHENIVECTDMVQETGGRSYMVMELLEGRTLSQAIRESGRIEPLRVVRIAAQVADALEAAHQKGIVHRDLKPDNVFLIRRMGMDDYVKLLDFGVARLRPDLGAMQATQTGAIIGTPAYMSPEQVEGRRVTAAADIYALGVLLFQMLTGRLPFDGPTVPAIMVAHVYTPPPSVETLSPSVPAALASLVAKALAKQPADRPPSMMAMRTAMLQAMGIDPADMPGSGAHGTRPGYEAGPGPGRPVAFSTGPTADATGKESLIDAIAQMAGQVPAGHAPAGPSVPTVHERPGLQAPGAPQPGPALATAPLHGGRPESQRGPGPAPTAASRPASDPQATAPLHGEFPLLPASMPGAGTAGPDESAGPAARGPGMAGSGPVVQTLAVRAPGKAQQPELEPAADSSRNWAQPRPATPAPTMWPDKPDKHARQDQPPGTGQSSKQRVIAVAAALAAVGLVGAILAFWPGSSGKSGNKPGDTRAALLPADAAADQAASDSTASAELRRKLDEASAAHREPAAPVTCQTRDPAVLDRLVRAASLLAGGSPGGKRNQDLEAIRVLSAEVPDSAEYWHWLGKARLYAEANPEAVLEATQRAIALCERFAAAHSVAGTALFRSKRPAEAEAHYRRALAQDPAFVGARFNVGLVQLQQGQVPEGIATLTEVIDRDPTLTEAFLARGQAHLMARQPERAVADLEQVTRQQPESAEAFWLLGQAYERLERPDEARRALCKSRDLGHPRAAERCPE